MTKELKPKIANIPLFLTIIKTIWYIKLFK